MKLKTKISLDDIFAKSTKNQPSENNQFGKTAFTHYLHNHKNVVSQFFINEAIQQVKRTLEYKYPETEISQTVAEEAF